MAVTVQARRVAIAPGFVVAVEQDSGLSWLSFGRPLPALATVPSQFWEGSHGLRKAMTVATAELIPVHTNPDGGNVVMGRDLHEFLESKEHYSRWITRLIEKYGFVAGQDFFSKMRKNNGRGRPVEDHIISLDMAKEISMIQRTERGKQARQYFIECEHRMKQLQPELTPEQLMAKSFTLLKAGFDHTAKTDYCSGVLLQRLEPSTFHPRQARSMHRTPEPFHTAPGFCLRMS